MLRKKKHLIRNKVPSIQTFYNICIKRCLLPFIPVEKRGILLSVLRVYYGTSVELTTLQKLPLLTLTCKHYFPDFTEDKQNSY